MLPVSELNRLRREAVRELEAQRAQPKRWSLECGVRNAECGVHRHRAFANRFRTPQLRTPHLIVLVRNLAQLDAALQCGVETVYCEFEDPKKYREAVARFARRRRCSALPQSELLRRSAADFQDGRGMDAQAGPLLRGGRLPGPQLRSPELFRERPAHWRLLAQHRQPAGGGLFQEQVRPGARHGLATI